MNLNSFSLIGFFTFLLILGTYIFAPTKGQTRIWIWVVLKCFFFGTLFSSWHTDNIVLKWILIEASTLFGSLLISSSGTEKTFQVGWKFLLINSYGLGIAFLGIVILLFASDPLDNLSFQSLYKGMENKSGLLVETGIMLVIYGYSAKLGLVPNHFWVGDTYAESPSQTSALIAAFVPVSVALALRPMVELERRTNTIFWNSANGLLFIGVLTIIYSLWVLYRREDIRRIAAKIALFHTGVFSVFIWLGVSESVFYFLLATTILVKYKVFISMGILRMDSKERYISKILESGKLSKNTMIAYLLALVFAFIFPFSPVFLLDLELVREAVFLKKYALFLVPISASIFFFLLARKVLPLVRLKSREYSADVDRILRTRLGFFYVGLFLSLILGFFGLHSMLNGGL